MKTEKLYRFPSKGYLGGVCHGIGEHTGVDPILWRVLACFSPFWIFYLVLWVVLDKKE